METSLTPFKIVRLTAIYNWSKQTIFVSCELERLQVVSESDTEQYGSENAKPLKEWIVRSHISSRGEQSILS